MVFRSISSWSYVSDPWTFCDNMHLHIQCLGLPSDLHHQENYFKTKFQNFKLKIPKILRFPCSMNTEQETQLRITNYLHIEDSSPTGMSRGSTACQSRNSFQGLFLLHSFNPSLLLLLTTPWYQQDQLPMILILKSAWRSR